MTTRFGLLAACALTACATVPQESATFPSGSRYVAMGSSYAAGPKMGHPKPGAPERCARDQRNYATLLAQRLDLDLVDVTCSGATTAHILRRWDELPSQLDSITPDTRLVTVTIGGNDVDFVRNLYVGACNPANTPKHCPPIIVPSEAQWAKLEANMVEIARQVRSRAPKSRLVFVDYISIIPSGAACPAVPMSPANAATMRQISARLAEVTAKASREGGAKLFGAGKLSQGHTACDPSPWSVGAPGSSPGAPWHPNAAGMAAIADALASSLEHGR